MASHAGLASIIVAGRLCDHSMNQRRFPPPWSVEEQDACFVVRDHNGQQLAYVYFENEPGRRSAAKLLTRDEAQRAQGPRQHVVSSYLARFNATVALPPNGVAGSTQLI